MKKTIHLHCTNILLSGIRVTRISGFLMAILFSNVFAQEEAIDYSSYEVPEFDEVLLDLNTNALQRQSNKLWLAHAEWIRNVMICLTDEDPSNYSIKRLLKNQEAIDKAIKTFYGDSLGKKFSELLYAHQAIADEMHRTSQAGDNEAHAEACRELRINKSEVLEFIRQANPLYTVAQTEGRD
jgi:hypothetical protein